MLKRIIGFAVLIALMGVSVGSSQDVVSQATAFDDNLYPTAIGNKWVYAVVGKNKEMTVAIVRNEKVGDQNCIVLEASMDVTKDAKTTREVVASEYIALVKGDYLRFKLGNGVVIPPLPFLKTGAKKGDAWTAKFELQVTSIDEKTKQTSVEKANATTSYTIGTETLTVPAGTFDCLAVKAATTEEGKVTLTTIWYAKGLGPVKQEFDFGKDEEGKENKFTLELKSTSSNAK